MDSSDGFEAGAAGTPCPSVQSVASAATVTPTFDNDAVKITAQAAALTLANPTGTAIDMAGMVIRIKDNGTARAISYGTQYRAIERGAAKHFRLEQDAVPRHGLQQRRHEVGRRRGGGRKVKPIAVMRLKAAPSVPAWAGIRQRRPFAPIWRFRTTAI